MYYNINNIHIHIRHSIISLTPVLVPKVPKIFKRFFNKYHEPGYPKYTDMSKNTHYYPYKGVFKGYIAPYSVEQYKDPSLNFYNLKRPLRVFGQSRKGKRTLDFLQEEKGVKIPPLKRINYTAEEKYLFLFTRETGLDQERLENLRSDYNLLCNMRPREAASIAKIFREVEESYINTIKQGNKCRQYIHEHGVVGPKFLKKGDIYKENEVMPNYWEITEFGVPQKLRLLKCYYDWRELQYLRDAKRDIFHRIYEYFFGVKKTKEEMAIIELVKELFANWKKDIELHKDYPLYEKELQHVLELEEKFFNFLNKFNYKDMFYVKDVLLYNASFCKAAKLKFEFSGSLENNPAYSISLVNSKNMQNQKITGKVTQSKVTQGEVTQGEEIRYKAELLNFNQKTDISKNPSLLKKLDRLEQLKKDKRLKDLEDLEIFFKDRSQFFDWF